jgi:hypothetical protein
MTYSRWLAATTSVIVLCAFIGMFALVEILVSVVREPSYLNSVADPFAEILDYPFTLRNQDCELLIYGDSTGVTGYDPVTIEGLTHLRTCNISQTRSIVITTGTFPLDRYLSTNKKPKYLAIQLSPETFYRDPDWKHLGDSLPMTELPRQDPGFRTDWRLMFHYKETINFFIEALRNKYSSSRREKVLAMHSQFDSSINDYYSHRGSLTLPLPDETTCTMPSTIWAPIDAKWIETVRRTYSAKGIRVLINASPIPDCDRSLEKYRKDLVHFADHELESYPVFMFNDLDRHFSATGRIRASTALAKQILAIAKENQPPRSGGGGY